jgi:hypothetical protein
MSKIYKIKVFYDVWLRKFSKQLALENLSLIGHFSSRFARENFNQVIKFRRVQTISQLPRYKKQVHVQLPDKDMRRGHIPLLPSTRPSILHITRVQTKGTPQRLLHDLPLCKSQRTLRGQPMPPRKLRSVPTVAERRGT